MAMKPKKKRATGATPQRITVRQGHPLYQHCMAAFMQTEKGHEVLRKTMEQLIVEFDATVKGGDLRVNDFEITTTGIKYDLDH